MSIKHTSSTSAELSYESKTQIEEKMNIRLLRDNIIVEPLSVDHCVSFEVIEYTKPLRGIVKAVGPGVFPWKYDSPDKHRRTKMWRSKKFQPTEVKIGDIVELGGYGEDDRGGLHRGYNFQQFYWGDKMHIVCREADVGCIVEEEPSTIE